MALKFRKASYEPGIVDLGTGCYAYLQPDGGWGFSNAGLVTDGGEALLIDTMFDVPHTRAMLDDFARASSAKIGTLVNTHHNGDHCFGNGCLDCEIVSTVSAAEAMKHETPKDLAQFMKAAPGMGLTGEFLVHCFADFDFDDCAVRAPDTTFTGTLSRMVGSKRVELIEVGPAHTGGDALVYVPADKTLFTGDILFLDGHPIVWAGPVANWIAACEAIDAMDVETIVPGHGPVTDKAGMRRLKNYLVYISDEARKRYDAGMGPLEAARSIALDDYAGWGDAERIAVNTATLYREFGSKDAPSDAATLFGWMAQLWKDKS
jgi:cyclase